MVLQVATQVLSSPRYQLYVVQLDEESGLVELLQLLFATIVPSFLSHDTVRVLVPFTHALQDPVIQLYVQLLQLCVVAGFVPLQYQSATLTPLLFLHVTVRDCELFEHVPQLPVYQE